MLLLLQAPRKKIGDAKNSVFSIPEKKLRTSVLPLHNSI